MSLMGERTSRPTSEAARKTRGEAQRAREDESVRACGRCGKIIDFMQNADTGKWVPVELEKEWFVEHEDGGDVMIDRRGREVRGSIQPMICENAIPVWWDHRRTCGGRK